MAVAANLLHHLAEPERKQTLTEMSRVARQAVISFEPNRNNPLMFLFLTVKPEERLAKQFTRSYMRGLFATAGLVNVHVHVEGWIMPNKAPIWWLPIGRALGRTAFRRLGFDICSVGHIHDGPEMRRRTR